MKHVRLRVVPPLVRLHQTKMKTKTLENGKAVPFNNNQIRLSHLVMLQVRVKQFQRQKIRHRALLR
jgi:hypothetical protein